MCMYMSLCVCLYMYTHAHNIQSVRCYPNLPAVSSLGAEASANGHLSPQCRHSAPTTADLKQWFSTLAALWNPQVSFQKH